ncbi:MAG: hypothetical protein BWZ02_02476 [Lentisphaerae bacterium ADurb.BinA184]|nr:MAG: hypothetical protein BWZ02_02476 [Lentisphaerae bacterium ADurb.BinA184]
MKTTDSSIPSQGAGAAGYALHEEAASRLPDDTARALPLIGNDELKLCVDARGAMHDFAARPSWPPPRIVWAGRRHNLRGDRYSSNLFEWGFLDLRLDSEPDLPEVTAWQQRLAPRRGLVETEITRGDFVERATSFAHLRHNLIVFHRRFKGVPAPTTLRAAYTFCHVGTEEIPFRTTWTPLTAWRDGLAADTTADGLVLYRGRVALWADRAVTTRAVDNRLELDIPLAAADEEVTVYLSLLDDLGADPQLLAIPDAPWMSPPVREVNRDVQGTPVVRPDPAQATAELRDWVAGQGYAGVLATHQAAWAEYWDGMDIRLPATEPDLAAALETQLYTLRCSATGYSLPANPFNSSWGAGYFWDERYGFEGLLAAGHDEIPRRTLEWRRRILPFSCMMASGRGARYTSCANEAGQQLSDRNGTQFYEFPLLGVIANYVREFCRYHDDDATRRRYYPLIRECAEYFRHWLLIELPGHNVMLAPAIDINESQVPVQDGPAMVCGAALALHLAAAWSEELGINEPSRGRWRHLAGLARRLADDLAPGRVAETGPLSAGPLTYTDFQIADLPAATAARDEAVHGWREAYKAANPPPGNTEHQVASVSGMPECLPLWSWGHLSNAYRAATLGDAAGALEQLRRSLDTAMAFGALNESADRKLTRVHHPWFTTAAGAYVRAVSRMLLFAKEREIRLLPGIPAGWDAFGFTLPAHGGLSVSVTVAGGELVRLALRPRAPEGRPREIRIPERFLPDAARLADPAWRVKREGTDHVLRLVVRGAMEVLRTDRTERFTSKA